MGVAPRRRAPAPLTRTCRRRHPSPPFPTSPSKPPFPTSPSKPPSTTSLHASWVDYIPRIVDNIPRRVPAGAQDALQRAAADGNGASTGGDAVRSAVDVGGAVDALRRLVFPESLVAPSDLTLPVVIFGALGVGLVLELATLVLKAVDGGGAGDGGGGGGNDGGASGGDEKPNPSSKRRPGKRGDGGARKPPTHSVVIIDVSQSVDLDHPRALEFLRVDAGNVNSFFARRGVPPLTTREVFDFVTADAGAYPDDSGGGSSSSSASLSTAAARGAAAPPTTTTPFTAATAAPASSCADFDPSRTSMMTPGEERHLGALLRAAALRSERSVASGGALAPERSAEDAVWASAHIPRRLADVADAEGDAARLAEGGGVAEGIYYQRFAGMAEDMGNVRIEEEKVEEEKEKKKERREKKKTVSFAAAADDDGENGGGEEEEEGAVCGASDSGDEDDVDSSSDSGSDDDSFSGSDSDFSDSSQRLRRRSLKARACNLPPDEADAARALRRAAKAEAKAGARERRKTKTPKHVKKRAAAKARKKKK